MIESMNTHYLEHVIRYVNEDSRLVPYLYVNLKTFDGKNSSVSVFCDFNEKNGNEIEGVYLLYYDCLHFYTKDTKGYSINKILDVVNKLKAKTLMLQEDVGKRISDILLNKYILERNYTFEFDMQRVRSMGNQNFRSILALRTDISEIVDLMLTDDEYSIVYDREVLLDQMLQRFDSGISRYYIVRDGGKIVASSSTYGETDDIALIGGYIVHNQWRRLGLISDVADHMCYDLDRDGKTAIGFVNYDNRASRTFHEKIGVKINATYYKFIRK